MFKLHTVVQGQGPLVLLSHALGCDLSMWDGVAAALSPHFTVLRADHRGHGRSARCVEPYGIDTLADDLADLIRAQGAGPAHVVGLSMGGMAAQSLGARHPALLQSLVVANSASHYPEAARAMWQARMDTVRQQGMVAIADGALQRWFTPEFRADSGGGQPTVAALRQVLLATDPESYAVACAAVAGIALDTGNRLVRCPTLVIAGSRDEATPPAQSQAIAQAIPGAQLQTLDAAHLSAVEQPEAFAQRLRDFWASLPAPPATA